MNIRRKILVWIVAPVALFAMYWLGFFVGQEHMHKRYEYLDIVLDECDTLTMLSSEMWREAALCLLNEQALSVQSLGGEDSLPPSSHHEEGQKAAEKSKKVLAQAIFTDYFNYRENRRFSVAKSQKIYRELLRTGMLSKEDVLNAFPFFSDEDTINSIMAGEVNLYSVCPSYHLRLLFVPENLEEFREYISRRIEEEAIPESMLLE